MQDYFDQKKSLRNERSNYIRRLIVPTNMHLFLFQNRATMFQDEQLDPIKIQSSWKKERLENHFK